MPAGRPSDYTPEVAQEICARLIEGKSLRSICLDEDMPALRTVLRWIAENEQFRHQYTEAKDNQADTLADEILHIADTPQIGARTKTTDKGTEITEGDMIEHRRLQVDARKWIASKLKPKKYGEKLEQTHKGDATAPIVISSTDADL